MNMLHDDLALQLQGGLGHAAPLLEGSFSRMCSDLLQEVPHCGYTNTKRMGDGLRAFARVPVSSGPI